MLYDEIKKERKRLCLLSEVLESQLHKYPSGELMCHKNGNYFRWRNQLQGRQQHISKSNTSLLTSLAEKKYLSSKKQNLIQEIEAFDLYLGHFDPQTNNSTILLDSPNYRPLLSTLLQQESEELETWVHSSYDTNPLFPEQLIHHSSSGNMVRSKSEALIDMALFQRHLPFRYECMLQLGDHIFYPDFTIMHPISKKIYYWEHCGRMDDPNYVKNLYTKLPVYNSYGIIQTVNLITTYESLSNPLDSTVVGDIISHYFS